MAKRIPLSQRVLPNYSKGEDLTNMITHIVGGALGLMVLFLCLQRSIGAKNSLGITGSAIYGFSMIALYAVSSIYHGLKPGMGKLVMQVVDHCTIYFLIVGTYTPILLAGFVPRYPLIGWGVLAGQWALGLLSAVLTAIDLRKYQVFSMICYILMGWCVIFFLPQTFEIFSMRGFYILLSGGIAYTLGAVLYGIGAKKPWAHSVFHVFVVLGSLLQFLAIYFYIL